MIPTEKELLDFIGRQDIVNFSLIARHYKLKNATVSDIIKDIERKKLIEVKKIGGSKIVRLVRVGTNSNPKGKRGVK